MAMRKDLPEGYSKASVALRIMDTSTADNSARRTKLVMKDNTVWYGMDDGSAWVKEGGDAQADTTVHEDAATEGTKPVDEGSSQAPVANTTPPVTPTVDDKDAMIKQLQEQNKALAERAAQAEATQADDAAKIKHLQSAMKGPHEGKPAPVQASVAGVPVVPLGHRGHAPRTVDEAPTVDELNAQNGQPARVP